jgi:hypothetical protein
MPCIKARMGAADVSQCLASLIISIVTHFHMNDKESRERRIDIGNKLSKKWFGWTQFPNIVPRKEENVRL